MDERMKSNYFIEDWVNTMRDSIKLVYPDIPEN